MSTNWLDDMNAMHYKFGIDLAVSLMPKETLTKFLEFRIKTQIKEEYDELANAFDNKDPEEVVDALIDLIVFATGTLDLFKVRGEAWDKVYEANIVKRPGLKPGRPNPFKLPDLIKPEGWKAPSHEGNHGLIGEIFEK